MPRMLDNISAAHRLRVRPRPGSPRSWRGSCSQGQPPFIPTDAQRAEVQETACMRLHHESVSVIMTIPETTLKR